MGWFTLNLVPRPLNKEPPVPLYEFECGNCDRTFDRVMTLKEAETTSPPCPRCGSDDVKKILSSGSVKVGLDGYAGKVR